MAVVAGGGASSLAAAKISGPFDARVDLQRSASISELDLPAPQRDALAAFRAAGPDRVAEIDAATGATRRLQDYSGFLTAPDRGTDPDRIARAWLAANVDLLGLTESDLDAAAVTRFSRHELSGTANLNLQQTLGGRRVFNGLLKVALDREGRIVLVNSLFLPDLAAALPHAEPRLAARAAIAEAARHLGLAPGELRLVAEASDEESRQRFVAEALSRLPIEARLMILPVKRGEARLVWNFDIAPAADAASASASGRRWNFNVDAVDGRVWTRFDRVDDGSGQYRVYPAPIEAPTFTTPAPPADARTLETAPADPGASPFAWHDTDGAAGAEFTVTRGNNVHAYTDTDNDNQPDPGGSPDGSPALDFSFPLDLTQSPAAYRPAAVTNLFYWNNFLHDVAYVYGFDEANGNFQENNYGNGGVGGDPVDAEAQDGGGINNARFETPPDGEKPRMQMYLWNAPTPDRDGDLDNGIIAHEYGHGISNRLVDGASVDCLDNAQQPGEGLSDWWALFFTQPDDTSSAARLRGIGTYALNQPTTGQGIRGDYYDGDPAVNAEPQENSWTYSTIAGQSVHGIGARWAQAYWQVTWALVDEHGYDAGLSSYTATAADAGNIRAMYYVVQGLKNTICSPAFTDVRDGILAAATAAYGGEDVCTIWGAFAEFGLGANATSGGPNSTAATDGFDLPESCRFLEAAAATQSICAGSPASYDLTVGVAFTPPVDLAVSGNPPPTTAELSPDPVLTLPAAATLALGNTASLAPGSYALTVTGNGDTANGLDLALEVYTGTPGAAALITPADGATLVPTRPSFAWEAVTGAVSYVLEVDDEPGFGSLVYVATVSGTSHTPESDLPSNSVLYWRVRTANPCGPGASSAVFDFVTVPEPGECALGAGAYQTYFHGWEQGAAGWTSSGTGDTWASSGTRVHAGAASWHAADVPSLSDQRLVSPPLALPANQGTLALHFWSFQAIEDNPPGCYDGGLLEISTNGGADWAQIEDAELLSDPYDGLVSAEFDNPLAGLPAWCGDPQDWTKSVVDLSAWAGQTVQLRFRLGTDTAIAREGWYLDDLEIQGCIDGLLFQDGLEVGSTSRWDDEVTE